MNEAQQTGALEAMLFAHAEPVETERLADALRLSAQDTEELLHGLQQRYDEQESGLTILHFEPDRWQMTTRPYYGEVVKRVLDTRRNAPLSPAALEVLAVIAYNQPVSRSFIEQVRGVDSSSTVTKLLEKGLIEEAGRLDLPGRPVAFQTTDTFLRVFGLGGLKDLPPLHDEVAEDAAAGGVQEAPMADGEEQAEQLEWK
ncbi:SMC-Scp complex subunit ScpB [uncultured Subdoligranulum sp.]|uniref:SMC-Scp complex subunit ScpB n=1 Tax=uncultured Subdoligranulum sp. TaxID=512298 RepID=UPI002632275E|nr:SMC-Scp complex subunit ScpB [uncultured Subdoligranulum sp.]